MPTQVHFKGSNRPVEKVSWEDAQIFLAQLNAIEQSAGRLPNGWKYVLPTEAQWEYACRAGTTTAYSWGMILILPLPIITGTVDQMMAMIQANRGGRPVFRQPMGLF